MDAVREAWALTVRRASHRPPQHYRDAVIFSLFLGYIESGAKGDYNGDWREDTLAKYLSKQNPSMLGNLNETELGKVFTRHDIGSKYRRGVYIGEKVGGDRHFSTIIRISEDDERRMAVIVQERLSEI